MTTRVFLFRSLTLLAATLAIAACEQQTGKLADGTDDGADARGGASSDGSGSGSDGAGSGDGTESGPRVFPPGYYVAPNGSDDNSGTHEDPFASVQHALAVMVPGDTLYLRGGTYHEQVDLSGVAGTEGKPITIAGLPGEEAIFDGTTAITSDWELDEGNVYKTTVTEDITQLFVDGKLMTLARFPNGLAFSEDPVFTTNGARRSKLATSTNGHVIDDPSTGPSPGLADSGVSYDGVVGVFNFGGPVSDARIVSNHTAGSAEFDYSPEMAIYKAATKQYFFEGGVGDAERVMLDMAQEWAYDEITKTLYLWADDGKSPAGRSIRGKTQTFAVLGDATTHHVVLDGLSFFATTFSFESSDNIEVRNCDLNYFTASRRALGDPIRSQTSRFVGTNQDRCENITVYNNEFRHADGRGLVFNFGGDVVIENNLFYKMDYACVGDKLHIVGDEDPGHDQTIYLRSVGNVLFRRNTIDTAGAAQNFWYAKNGDGYAILEYNYTTKCASQQDDGSTLYMVHGNVVESVARYNWFYGNYERDFRWDGHNNPLQGVDANIYRNVSMAAPWRRNSTGDGYRLKGDFHEIYNNLGVNEKSTLNVALDKGGNANTVTRNNVAQNLTDDPIPGASSHNYVGQNESTSVMDLLRDPENFDFRPRADADELVDQGTEVFVTRFAGTENEETIAVTEGYLGAAPDIGPYEHGADTYWIGGRQEAHASTPVPKAGGTNVKRDVDLMYLIGLDGVSAKIYFGTSKSSLELVESQDDPHNIVVVTDGGSLKSNTTYYWRVDTILSDDSVVEGETWSFITGS